MKRSSWPVIDCYMPALLLNSGSGSGGLNPKHNPAAYNPALVKVPDTRNDPFYRDLVAKVLIPRAVMESGVGGEGEGGIGAGVGKSALPAADSVNEPGEVKPVAGGKRKERAGQSSHPPGTREDSSHPHSRGLHPYVVCSTVHHTMNSSSNQYPQSSLLCMDISTSAAGGRVACGFQDSVIRVWDLPDPSYTSTSTSATASASATNNSHSHSSGSKVYM